MAGYNLYTDRNGKHHCVHGYVARYRPIDSNSYKYFTGTCFSQLLDEAKVFRTKGGAKSAVRHWDRADYHSSHISPEILNRVEYLPVKLTLDIDI